MNVLDAKHTRAGQWGGRAWGIHGWTGVPWGHQSFRLYKWILLNPRPTNLRPGKHQGVFCF